MGIVTVLWEKWTEFRRDYVKITLQALLTPLMYLIVFGYGLGGDYEGRPYLYFLIPGLVCMTVMTSSFSSIIQNMSVQRLYERALDQVIVSPTPLWQFLTGQVVGGMLRGIYGGAVILLLTSFLHTGLIFNLVSILVLLLNGAVFASLALTLSFFAKSYADAPRFTNYVIMPMSFLCNTFFSAGSIPYGVGKFISILPLSLTCSVVRTVSGGGRINYVEVLILVIYLAVFSAVSFVFVYKKKNL